jgi:transcriptional regulator
MQIGTRLLNEASARPGEGLPAVPPPLRGEDGTLLAVVPIPGTRTSLAIVGYPVTAPGAQDDAPPVSPDGRTGLLLDHDQRRVWVDGREIALTFQEYELLAFLTASPGKVFSRVHLMNAVWSGLGHTTRRTVDVHIHRLRRKLGRPGEYLVTVRRFGYGYQPPADDATAG